MGKNPIERRLNQVHDEWVRFAELPQARLLCLLVEPDEVALFEAFIATESDADAGSLPDLFVRLRSMFHPGAGYGFALAAELATTAEALREGAGASSVTPWTPPASARDEDDVAYWVRTCQSFFEHHALPADLATLLEPEVVTDQAGFQLWLRRLVAALPSHVRVVILDDARSPALTSLTRAEPVRVVVAPLAADMAGARMELSQEAGGLDTPGGQYRDALLHLTHALAKGELETALRFGSTALAVAAANGWFALVVPIQFALGAALAGAGRGAEAHERYLAAERAASEGESAGDSNCGRLRVQARMVRGGLLVSIAQYAPAATLFLDTIPLATTLGEPRMVLDCYRLASFSFEQNGQHSRAWQTGIDGLGYAGQLDTGVRRASTLPYLGEGLLRLTERGEYAGARARIDRELATLLDSPKWRPSAAQDPG